MKSHAICCPHARRGAETLYYFEKKIDLSDPREAVVRVMADARYKLWVNGTFVAAGPCKGTRDIRYYDELNLTPYLTRGENTLSVTLLGLSSSNSMDYGHPHLLSVIRDDRAYFFMEGTVRDGDQTVDIATDRTWLAVEETHDTFSTQFFVGMNEHITPGFGKPLAWENAEEMPLPVLVEGEEVPFGEILASYAAPRPIPMMFYREREFSCLDGYYDAGELTTGYVRMRATGKGKITLTYGECFVKGDAEHFEKGDRTDTTGFLLGHDDTFEVDGELAFESFWFRTFRFIRAVCEGDVRIETLSYVETGYPLTTEDDYDYGDERRNALWDISLRTLRRCMQETYVDCPYYEQLQYCMDTYSQILYTYMISPDTRLARRALRDFGSTWRPGFLTEARAPSSKRQYIPGFSLFYIYMVNMYEARTEDDEEVRQYLPVIDGILDWFSHNKNGAGLIKTSNMWDFVDWADDWRAEEGAPVTRPEEGIAVYSLMYAYALQKAARLMRVFGRGATAEEYLIRADEMLDAVRAACFDPATGLYFDSERRERASQHTQIWAVLAGLSEGETAKTLLKTSLTLSAKGGYAYAYLWFRALEKAGCYDLGDEMMEQFYGLLDLHCSTVPEMPYPYTRSECHAWGAVALYEFTTMTLGVKLRDDSPRVLKVEPYPQGQRHAQGSVFTKWGRVHVAWEVADDTFVLRLETPDTVAAEVTVPAGYAHYAVILNGKPIPPYAVK